MPFPTSSSSARRRCRRSPTVPSCPSRPAARHELVGRLRSDVIRAMPDSERKAFFTAVQGVLASTMPKEIVRSVPGSWRWSTALARTATPDEFWSAEALMTTTLRTRASSAPGAELLRGTLSSRTLDRAVALLGRDEPLPPDRAAPTRGSAFLRRVKETGIVMLGALPGGRLRSALVAWGRTPARLVRDAAALGAVAAAVTACAVEFAGGRVAATLGACAVGGALTARLALRSTGGTATALRATLLLVPGVSAAWGSGSPAGWAAVATAVAAIVVVFALDRRWRRTNVRAHASRSGGLLNRVGWITLAASALVVVVVAADAIALATR